MAVGWPGCEKLERLFSPVFLVAGASRKIPHSCRAIERLPHGGREVRRGENVRRSAGDVTAETGEVVGHFGLGVAARGGTRTRRAGQTGRRRPTVQSSAGRGS